MCNLLYIKIQLDGTLRLLTPYILEFQFSRYRLLKRHFNSVLNVHYLNRWCIFLDCDRMFELADVKLKICVGINKEKELSQYDAMAFRILW